MNGALLSALERIEREKGIEKEVLFEAIESALASAARKVIDDPEISKEDIEVEINKETGEIEVYSDGVQVQNERFGRIAAQTAKQVIIQKIREAERDVIFDKYTKKVGSIISGSVHRFEKGNVVVELDDTESILPKYQQIPRERFRQGELIRAYLLKVERGSGAPEIVLSRSDAGFVKKLFELEVPEISQGIVEIKTIAREVGERTKIAVYSKDERIDPVGACVGMRGSRVRDIVKELHGERIDIIPWSSDIREYLPFAVSPAEISRMLIDRENKKITLTVAKDQLALLIGKRGGNIRLASKLVGWELVAEKARETVDVSIDDLKGIGKKTVEALIEAGLGDVDSVLEAGVDTLVEVDGVGKKTAEKIVAVCEEAHAEAIKDAESARIFAQVAEDEEKENVPVRPDIFAEAASDSDESNAEEEGEVKDSDEAEAGEETEDSEEQEDSEDDKNGEQEQDNSENNE